MARYGSGILIAALVGCAVDVGTGAEDSREIGDLALELTWSGRQFDEVSYEIDREGQLHLSGVIDVSDSAHFVTKFIGNVPAGGYTIRLLAVSTDGDITCRGASNFYVYAGETSVVQPLIICDRGYDLGGIEISTQFDDCVAYLGNVVAEPTIAAVGNTIALYADASLFQSVTWTATSGTIDRPSAPDATYTCTEAGTHTITFTLADMVPDCEPLVIDIEVDCLGP